MSDSESDVDTQRKNSFADSESDDANLSDSGDEQPERKRKKMSSGKKKASKKKKKKTGVSAFFMDEADEASDEEEEEEDDLLDTFYDLPRQEQKDVLYVLSRLCTERLKDFPESTASLGIDEARINPARKEIAKKIVGTELQVLKSYIITPETEDAVFESLGLGYF
mmetsp:Transcript_19682/g.31770  ORF Transcript_19682/g.31770 Transcript_19682/m.31770 type:complete len:166 (+) Transcript_19682:80-577(+)